jgi:hypothetical protein
VDFLLTFVGLATLVPAVVLVVSGVRLAGRPSKVHRVPVEATVVHFTVLRRAPRVTFDYPAPDGTWLRTTRMAGLVPMQRQGLLVRPGDRMTVYVDPTRPHDVSLGTAGSAGGFLGIALIVFGAMLGVLGITVLIALVGRVA